ncbi:MAG: bacillithiol biosynthesis cysteine-adding enzyme BshC [Vicinamibacteria bacterium]
MPASAREILAFASLGQPLSPLFLDYLQGRATVVPFLGGSPLSLEAVAKAAEASLAHPRPSSRVAEALVRQQRARGAEAAAANARRLAGSGTVAVVTGQQPGIFGGPLFVLLKALATVEVARRLEEGGRPAVPVFWIASDDHDFAEVRSTSVLDATGALRTLRYDPRREPAGEPAWAIGLDDTIGGLVDELGRALPPALGRDETLEAVAACYVPGETISGAFGRFVSRILPGLVVLDPSDPELKALAVPVLARELREGSPTSRLAIEQGQRLLAAGYHQQVPVRPGFLNAFVLAEGQRRALAFGDGTIEIRGTRERIDVEEAVRRLESDPSAWSPGALLRPLVQDALLPTAAYVGGPAEIAYHAQIAPSYAHFGIPRPVILPRPSATIVEPPHARALDAEGLALADLVADPEALVTRWARETYPDVEGAFASTREALERETARLEELLGLHDPTLRAAAASARGRALHQIEGLHEKALRALKKRDQGRADRLRRTRDALFPGGSLQERGIGLVSALARHGLSLAEVLRERIDVFADGHQVVRL